MKITVEVNPEDLAIITEQVMKAAGPEAMSKIWIAISNQIVEQMQAHMLSQVPEPFRPFFNMQSHSASEKNRNYLLYSRYTIFCMSAPHQGDINRRRIRGFSPSMTTRICGGEALRAQVAGPA